MARILHHPYATSDELLDQVASMLSGPDLAEAWTAFTCLEVEALAELLRHFHRTEAAEAIVALHAAGDEPGDLHYHSQG